MCEVDGVFYNNDWWPSKNSTHYTCQVQDKKITEKNITKINGIQKPTRDVDDVVGVRFDDCEMDFIPTGLTKIFKNMKIFLIFNSKINKIRKEDFAEYSQITQLWFSILEIEYLPGNLLDLMPNLEIVSFKSCKIKYIDSNLFDNHPNMKVAKFNSNVNINCFYDSVTGNEGGISFEELKKTLEKPEIEPPKNYETYYDLNRGLAASLVEFLNDEENSDTSVTVDGETHKFHRILLQARSAKLREMIKNGDELKFDGFSMETFKNVVEYFHHNKLKETSDMVELIKIAELLEVAEIKKFAMNHLDRVEVTGDNALSMMKFAKEIGNQQLRDKSFMEIKKMLPEKKLKDEWIDDVEKVKSILEAKQKMEEEIRKAQEKFDEMFE